MVLTEKEVGERWAELSIYTESPMRPRLSGLAIEYAILQVYSRDVGQRSAIISFNVGQGSQDIGFRNMIDVLFTAVPAHPLRLRVLDEHGQPATASFLVRDDEARIYPNIAKRLAPDFFFQPQVYRADGQTIDLPAGAYTVDVSRGPEYLPQTKRVSMSGPQEMLVRLARWIDPSRDGWYSGRSSHPLVRLLPLRKPDRGGAAEGHVAADRRRGAERRERAHVGAVVLLSEAVLQR